MSKVQRYSPVDDGENYIIYPEKDKQGGYVEYGDYEELEKKIKVYKSAFLKTKKKNRELKIQRDRLLEQIDRMAAKIKPVPVKGLVTYKDGFITHT